MKTEEMSVKKREIYSVDVKEAHTRTLSLSHTHTHTHEDYLSVVRFALERIGH